ncbi:hypothetical protein KQY27_00235 [Methanobrevibacter sp. TMH8]|uniref:TFIIB-type zinc ribbon-containing protein n=1 Tax=Methanobrevibacter sp. TMH8 TaxID=2848611 RepID=UPI001CCA5F98|nr:TFIIB-type zinc ribbon-containing protein [Methanobrevibacter sp. TMH8]MBZ9569986.1 hypothetical protein [Methanobrevibacter sp. TMH8]
MKFNNITKCPKCGSSEIDITYNHQIGRFTLSCFDCNTYHKITPKQADIKCPRCESKNISYEEIETVCEDCGLVLQGVPPVYVGYTRVVFDFGLKL